MSKYEGVTFWINESDVRDMERHGAKEVILRPIWRPDATVPVTFGTPHDRNEAAARGALTLDETP